MYIVSTIVLSGNYSNIIIMIVVKFLCQSGCIIHFALLYHKAPQVTKLRVISFPQRQLLMITVLVL